MARVMGLGGGRSGVVSGADPAVQPVFLRAPGCSHLARPHWVARRVASRQRRAEAATFRALEPAEPTTPHVLSGERGLKNPLPHPHVAPSRSYNTLTSGPSRKFDSPPLRQERARSEAPQGCVRAPGARGGRGTRWSTLLPGAHPTR